MVNYVRTKQESNDINILLLSSICITTGQTLCETNNCDIIEAALNR